MGRVQLEGKELAGWGSDWQTGAVLDAMGVRRDAGFRADGISVDCTCLAEGGGGRRQARSSKAAVST